MNDELLTRAVSNVTPRDLAEKKLETGKPLRLYLGIDPTGNKLTLGHSVPLRKLKAFQDAGHEVIFLIGSFTAMIGDPTDRDAMREPLTRKQIDENFKTYKQQASKILDFDKIEVVHNHEWLEKLTFEELINISSNFTVQQMLERDMFEKRMNENKPIHMHEFFYPLMQGYDSVMLDVDLEIGGNDQYFNMLAGRTLQHAFSKREKFVLTTKLIEGTDGRKMSKTYGNCIYLEDSATDMFGKTMSINDDLMHTYFECCTDVPMNEVQSLLERNPRDTKVRLAKEIVTLYHSADEADRCEAEFNNVFKGGGVPDDVPEATVKKGTLLIDVIAEHGLAASKSEARRIMQQGGVKVNDEAVTDLGAEVKKGMLKVGKRKFLKVTIG